MKQLIIKNIKKLIIIISVLMVAAIIVSLVLLIKRQPPMASQPNPENQNQPAKSVSDQAPGKDAPTAAASTTVSAASSTAENLNLYLPISEALTRVTKKPFGLYISPNDSPVSPERFSGYHTGVDFETSPQEQAIDVPVYAICAGPLILKKIATGYGGVAVQSCQINQESVTVIYGHLRLASITASQDALLSLGQQIGVLGEGDSAETSGERKHLHLGIHKGSEISLLGYVPDKSKLNQWLDFITLVK